ncbi:MAG: universal stress protein [Gordonia sp. (in: high G+C Gram-positive bacteria)]|uniref:universal stress protein n=1 Tax=Gordonia sp. (in: high G+C Gram-positive bacteria) TaxID=84139 RepID=UPI003C71B183
MTIAVSVPDSVEGRVALAAAVDEARSMETDLVAINLSLHKLDLPDEDCGVKITVVDRSGRGDRDPVDAILDEVAEHGATRLVIGVKRRSRTGKALFGSVSQRLLIESPIPVLAVKTPEE